MKTFCLFLCLFFTATVVNAETLTVGISPNAPFTYQDRNGDWTGLSVTLWEEFAKENGYEYEYKALEGVHDALNQTQMGAVDLAIGPITMTSKRLKAVDYSKAYFNTGLGMAVKKETVGFFDVLGKFSKQIGYLLLFIAIGGLLVVSVEKKHNEQLDSIIEGLWFAITTATTTGYGDLVPKTSLGRLLGAILMLTSALYFPMLVAGISTSMTLEEYKKVEITPENIQDYNVGVVKSTTSAEYFHNKNMDYRGYTSAEHLLDALELGKIDVAVFDRPVLQYESKRRKDLLVLPNTLDTQYYGVIFSKENLDITEKMDYFIPSFINSPLWIGVNHTFLGK